MAWEKVKLGELYEVHNGLSKGGKFFGSGFPFLSFSTVFNNWFIPKEIKDLVQSTEKEQESYSIKEGDVFITRTSETADELGMSCVALKDYPQATYNGFCKRLRPIQSKYEVSPRYIGYYLRTSFFRGKFLGLSGTMTTRASLRNEDLLAMEIPLPPLKTQKRIADILSAYDNLIENNQKQIKLLDEAAQRLYKQWFIDLKFPGYETTKIVDGLPEGWKKRIISEVCETIGGGTPSTSKQEYYHNGKIPWATPTDLTKNDSLVLLDTEKKITEEGLKHSSAKLLPCNSILMTSRASIGYFAICDFPVCTNQGFISCIPYNSDMFYYLLFNLMCRVDEIKGKATGSTFLEITKREFRNMEIVVPSESLLKKFSKIIEPVVNKIRTVKKEIVGLTQSRDRLLPKLMNNEIEV